MKYIIIIICIIVIFFIIFTNIKEHLEILYNDDDYEKTLNNIDSIFEKYSEYKYIKNDKDYIESIYNFKIIHDFYTSILLDIKNKQEILYCMIPPDQKDLCRGFRILDNQTFDKNRLKEKLNYTKSSIIKIITNKLNLIINKYNDKMVIETKNTFIKQLEYIIESIYKKLI